MVADAPAALIQSFGGCPGEPSLQRTSNVRTVHRWRFGGRNSASSLELNCVLYSSLTFGCHRHDEVEAALDVGACEENPQGGLPSDVHHHR